MKLQKWLVDFWMSPLHHANFFLFFEIKKISNRDGESIKLTLCS